MPIYPTGKIKDGRKQYRVKYNYVDRNGKYKQLTKCVYGLNEAKLAEMELQIKAGETVTPKNKTVLELYEEYIKYKKSEVRLTSLEKTKSILNREIIPVLGDTSLSKLNPPMLQEWKNSLNEKDLATITKQRIFGEFRALLNYAVKMEYIPKNPLTSIGNFKEVYFEKPQEKLQYYTPAEFKKYIAVAKKECTSNKDFGYYVFFNIAYFTGMRKGEINALKWTDVEDNVIHVRRSVAQKVKGQPIVETPPKNKTSYRDIQIPTHLQKLLKEQKARQSTEPKFNDDFRVCGGSSCLGDTSISNKNKEFATKAGLEIIRIHDFRHSHASLLVNNGINIQEVARRLGHAKIEMTWNTYSHLYPKEEERAIKILEKI